MWTRKLCMANRKLCGKAMTGQCEPLEPETISRVREYGWNNPFLLVVSQGRKYAVRPWAKDYEEIVEFLEDNTGFNIRGRFVYRYNKFLFRTPLTQLFRRRKARK